MEYNQNKLNACYLRRIWQPNNKEENTPNIVEFFRLAINNPHCQVGYQGKIIKEIKCENEPIQEFFAKTKERPNHSYDINIKFEDDSKIILGNKEFYNTVQKNGKISASRDTNLGNGGVYLEFKNTII